LLAPVLLFGTDYETSTGSGTYSDDGFVSVRLISTQTGRIEADPTGEFGGDLFVISRGTNRSSGGLISTSLDDAPGRIYRVDPYAVNAFGTSPSQNRRLFAEIPGGGGSLGFGGYENWYDLAFDSTGAFDLTGGGNPSAKLFVTSVDATVIPGVINPSNAIYALRPDGTFVTGSTSPSDPPVFAYSDADAGPPQGAAGVFDNNPAVLATAPGDAFGTALYALDVRCDIGVLSPTTSCQSIEGNVIYRIPPETIPPARLDSPIPQNEVLNRNVEAIVPPVAVPAGANIDIDARAMAFDPNRGIILQGQNGEPAFQLYGGLFVASSDVEALDTALTRILYFPNLTAAPIDFITPVPTSTLLIGDMTFDPIGHMAGGLFLTDYVSGSVLQVVQDPVTGRGIAFPIATGFNVPRPSAITGITPEQAYTEPFSIAFSPDGEILYISDRDGIYALYANTLANTAAGAAIGLTDVRELDAPYTGNGFGAAVIDDGIDSAHLGFRGTVSCGFNPFFGSCGTIAQGVGHGTAVAGIIHQIVPDAVLVPVNALSFAPLVGSGIQELYNGIQYIRDNPVVDDPRTPAIDPVPIVAVNMSLGFNSINYDSDRQAVEEDRSTATPLRFVFQDYLRANGGLGIVPIASAGNSGQDFNGMDGADIPAILNEVVEVVAAYPFGPQAVGADFPDPRGGVPAPPITLGGTVRCVPEAGDSIIYPGKVTAFSSRSQVSDFAGAGTCVSTYGRSLFLSQIPIAPVAQGITMAPLLPNFNGTSAAAPTVAGSFVYTYDVVAEWAAVAATGGVIDPVAFPALAELHRYLLGDLQMADGRFVPQPNLSIRLGAGAIPNLAAYLNPDGVNSILQWTAIPREDVNIGAGPLFPTGTDDDVEQQRLLQSSRYRTYSHVNIATALSAIEGTVALRYFQAHPAQRAALDAAGGPNSPGLITPTDIDCFVTGESLGLDCAGTVTSNDITARAMARLLGGTDRIARRNRFTFLDLVQNERQEGVIRVDQIDQLLSRLLPGPRDFVITNRHASADRRYALESNALRNYHDLLYLSPDSMIGRLDERQRGLSPAQITVGFESPGSLTPLPYPVRDQFDWSDTPRAPYVFVGHAPTNPPPCDRCGGLDQPVPIEVTVAPGSDDLASVADDGTEFVYRLGASGHLIEFRRNTDGAFSRTDVTSATGSAAFRSDVAAVDLAGGGRRSVAGLLEGGRVQHVSFSAGGATVRDITGAHTVDSSLTGYVVRPGGLETELLYGLNQSGELIEHRGVGGNWTSRNVTQSLPGAPALQSGIAAAGATNPRGGDVAFVYGRSTAGHLIEYVRNGATWTARDLTTAVAGPAIAGSLVADVHNEGSTRVRHVFGLDPSGNLVHYFRTGRQRWRVEIVNRLAGGPTLAGEVAAQYDAATGTMSVLGHDRRGRFVEYMNSWAGWTYTRNGRLQRAANFADTTASSTHRIGYAETVDGALAAFWYAEGRWNSQRIDPLADTPASLGVDPTLVELGLASQV
jgi:hypothetical protein